MVYEIMLRDRTGLNKTDHVHIDKKNETCCVILWSWKTINARMEKRKIERGIEKANALDRILIRMHYVFKYCNSVGAE